MLRRSQAGCHARRRLQFHAMPLAIIETQRVAMVAFAPRNRQAVRPNPGRHLTGRLRVSKMRLGNPCWRTFIIRRGRYKVALDAEVRNCDTVARSGCSRLVAASPRAPPRGTAGRSRSNLPQHSRVDAQHADSLHLLGMIEHQRGHHEVAVEMIGQAIAVRPKEAAYHSNLGTILQAQGKLDEAAACFERALALKPDWAEVHSNLGNVLQTQGRLDEAAACQERALALKPDCAEACSNLGNIRQAQGKLDRGRGML